MNKEVKEAIEKAKKYKWKIQNEIECILSNHHYEATSELLDDLFEYVDKKSDEAFEQGLESANES